MAEENSRASYGIDDKKSYDETTKDFFEQLDGSISGVSKHPINHCLKSFSKEFVQNERMGMQLFNVMNAKIEDLSKTIEESPFYKDMDVVRDFLAILEYMSAWALNQRQSIILAKTKMQEVKKVVDDDYVTQKQFDIEIEQYNFLLKKNMGLNKKLPEVTK